ncbi:MAG: BTAD domain-containing putative transcriptional regulator [Acidimicrobiia bacterium]
MAGPLGPLDVAGARARALLSCLVLHADQPVAAELLIDWVWGEALPRNPLNALQVQLSKLRRLLSPHELVASGSTYRLLADRDEVDAHRFERLAAAARQAREDGEALRAAALFDEAAGLWRGVALAEVDHPDAVAVRSRLEELRLDTVEHGLHLRLETAGGEQLGPLIAELELQCARQPLRERLRTLHITALYRSGRQAEALRAFQEARRTLVEEIGVEPGAELRALEAAILAQDPQLGTGSWGEWRRLAAGAATVGSTIDAPAPLAEAAPPSGAGAGAEPELAPLGSPPPGNLPVDLTPFIGRRAELAEVARLLDGPDRLFTLVGPGGAGKTRLALAAARAVQPPPAAGLWLVELAPVLDGDVDVAVATAIGALEGPEVDTSAGVTARLRAYIARRPLLLVLDNCEHVIVDAARLVDELLRACPELRVLATSREGLGVPGERLWPVPPLVGVDAVELFVQRARAHVAGFAPDERELATVAELCARLDGLPLALELAAARLRSLTLDELAGRLDDRFRLLTGGARSVLPRQQTLRALVDWSYDLLDERERRVWQALSAMSGGCRLDAAEAVCADELIDRDDVLDLLDSLVDKSLVAVTRTEDAARYGLLQTIALYGREKLAASGRAEAVRDRHLAFWASLAPGMLGGLQSPEQGRWLSRLRADVDNVRACVAWAVQRGDAVAARAIASGTLWFFWLEGDLGGSRDLLAQALAIPSDDDSPAGLALRARCLASAAWLDNYTDARGMAALLEAVELAKASGDSETIGFAMLLAANHSLHYGDGSRMAALVDEAEAHLQASDYRWGLAAGRLMKAMFLGFTGRTAEAAACIDDAMARFRAVGDRWGIGVALSEVADIAERRGDYDTTIAALEESRALLRQSGSQPFDAFLQARLGNVLVLQGRLDEAEKLHEEALAASTLSGLVPERAMALVSAGFSRTMAGRFDEAYDVLIEAVRLGEDDDADGKRPRRVHIAAIAHARLGFLAERQERAEQAEAHHLACLRAMVTVRDVRGTALALEGLAGVAALRGDGERAAFLLGAGHGLRSGVGAPQPPAERALDVDRIEAAARDLLGGDAERFEQAFSAGAAAAAEPEGLVAPLLGEG